MIFLDYTEEMDPLLDCLVILSKLNHRPLSAKALSAGLPLVNNQLTPNLFVRAAERAGFDAEIFKEPLTKVSELVLPSVLLLKGNRACILQHLNEDNTANVIFPEKGENPIRQNLSELSLSYTGYLILLRPSFHFESRAETVHEKPDPSIWFWNSFWRFRFVYLQVVIAAFLINIFALVSPLFVMNVYDRVVPNSAFTTLWVLAIGVIIIYCFDFVLRTLRSYLIDVCGRKADILMSCNIFQHALGIQMASKPTSVGAFVSNLREFEILRDFFTSATLTTLIDLPFVVLFFLLTWYIGGAIVLVPLIIVPLALGIALLLEKPLRKVVFLAMEGSIQKHAILVESISGLETIKCLMAEGQIQKKWEDTVGTTAKLSLKARFLSGFVVNIISYTQQMVTVGIIILGVYEIQAGHLTLGGLIACNILAGRILAPLASMANILTRFQQAKMSLESLSAIMEMPEERPLGKHFLHLPELKGNIEFINVSFKYPGTDLLALDNVSFKISANESLAIVGRIGSGKSTIQKLLLGLYKPTSGEILMDGIDINQIDPIDLRHNMAYVPQDSLLFFGSIRDNIAMSMPMATDEEILNAAQLAGVDTFVRHHPSGYEMQIGERGEGLSGGQRQAITIARALLPNPKIWLFDEPTSAMDNTTEMELLQRFSSMVENKTFILATHKITLFPLVDRVLVMDGGRLIVDGPKQKVLELLAKSQEEKK